MIFAIIGVGTPIAGALIVLAFRAGRTLQKVTDNGMKLDQFTSQLCSLDSRVDEQHGRLIVLEVRNGLRRTAQPAGPRG